MAGPDGKPVRPVRGIGPVNPRIAVFGEGPGRTEEVENVPLIGPSGQLLMRALKTVGVKREEVFFGNVTLCKPPNRDKDKIVAEAAKHCRKRFEQEVQSVLPAPILALGGFASTAFLGEEVGGILSIAGSYSEIPFGRKKARVVVSPHPAMILRGGSEAGGGAHTADLLYWGLLYDAGKVVRIADGEMVVFPEDIDIEWRNPKRAEALLEAFVREARKAGRVGIDTETTGVPKGGCTECHSCEGHTALEARHARLVAIGLATEERAIALYWRILTPRAKELIRKLLADLKVATVIHNRAYDEVVLERRGFPIRGRIECTLLQHHNSFPGMSHKLQRVATQFFAIPPWKAEHVRSEGADGVEGLLRYCALDVLATTRLRPQLQICIKRTQSEKTYEMDLRKAEIAVRMQDWGMPVDLEANRQITERFHPIIDQTRTSLFNRLGAQGGGVEQFHEFLSTEQARKARKSDPNDYASRQLLRKQELSGVMPNLNAPPHVAALLKACGVKLTAVTGTGATTTKREILEEFEHPAVKELLRYRDYEYTMNNFLAPMASRLDKNLRMHPEWSVNKITGRFSSSPNCQNSSKGTTNCKSLKEWCEVYDSKGWQVAGLPNLRWQVIAPKGRIFVGADAAQGEARIIALLSGDEYLCKAFNEDIDIHSEFCKEIWPEFAELAKKVIPQEFTRIVKHEMPWKGKRDSMKSAEYGYFYGAVIMTIWKQLIKDGYDVSVRTIAQMFKTFRTRMPKVAMFHDSLFREVLEKKEIRSFLLGRRRAFPLGSAEPTVVKNFGIQSSLADIMDTALTNFYDRMDKKRDWIWNQSHDFIGVETDEDRAEEVAKLLKECMTQTFEVRGTKMKFPAEVAIGSNWADV